VSVASVASLSWLEPLRLRLWQARREDRLPHALLLTGPAGVGKEALVRAFSASLLCAAPGALGEPCGGCRGCELQSAGTHPDFRLIQPEEAGKQIRIDQIREYTEQAGLASLLGGYKVALLQPAEAMNTAAANSLLKTLEEPVRGTLLLLLSARPGALPATIRSRCQRLEVLPPPRAEALAWLRGQPGVGADADLRLRLATGAPLLAAALGADQLAERARMLEEFLGLCRGKGDLLAVAERWSRLELAQVLNWLSGWLTDLLRLQVTAQPPVLINADQAAQLAAAGRGLERRRLFLLLDRVLQARRDTAGALNAQMLLESLLLDAVESTTL
jgi:DNA polymerase III subunit delta'